MHMLPIRPTAAALCTLVFSGMLAGCAVAPPLGPSVSVMPGKDKSFAAFQADDAACRQYAAAQIGDGSPADAANQSALASATLGTLLGAAAGAAIGAATGNPAAGAAIGAGGGLFAGGTTGIAAAQAAGSSLQGRYDTSYMQCMSAKGALVPHLAYTAYPGYAVPTYYPSYYPYGYGATFLSFGFGFRSGGHHRSHHH
jgi:hypothetical protein